MGTMFNCSLISWPISTIGAAGAKSLLLGQIVHDIDARQLGGQRRTLATALGLARGARIGGSGILIATLIARRIGRLGQHLGFVEQPMLVGQALAARAELALAASAICSRNNSRRRRVACRSLLGADQFARVSCSAYSCADNACMRAAASICLQAASDCLRAASINWRIIALSAPASSGNWSICGHCANVSSSALSVAESAGSRGSKQAGGIAAIVARNHMKRASKCRLLCARIAHRSNPRATTELLQRHARRALLASWPRKSPCSRRCTKDRIRCGASTAP
ncbi:MAG: hypothetical protein R3E68_02860 [Burkholderiaceae bacterium]